MSSPYFSRYLRRSRMISVIAPWISSAAAAAIVVVLFLNVHIASVIGTTAAATVAACATFARAHYRTQKYVRFAIRARLTKKPEPDFEKWTRQIRESNISRFVPKSAHPSPEIVDALHEAEKRMGMRPGSALALVVPLELILGVPHNCPAAAAMLYAGRHPVILIDDNLQYMLDFPDDFERAHKAVVSVLCHELAHLVGWNTRWTRLVAIGELFVTTAAMASLVAYGLEHTFTFGIVGAVIAAIHLGTEPALADDEGSISVSALLARLSILAWVPYVIAGIVIGAIPFSLALTVTGVALGLRYVLAMFRRKEEFYADIIAAHALGSSSPLSDFFRSLSSDTPTLWSSLFASHPPIPLRIKRLRSIKL